MGTTETRLVRLLEAMEPPPTWAAQLVLAEDDYGDLLLPCVGRRARKHAHPEMWWDRRFNGRNPLHWPYFVMTWLTGWVVCVDVY